MTAWLIHDPLCAGIQKRNCCKVHGQVLLHPLRLLTQHARRSAVSLASPADQRTVTLVASPFHLQVHRNAIPLVESIWRELVCGVAEKHESSVDSPEEQPHSVQSRETLGENREKSGEKSAGQTPVLRTSFIQAHCTSMPNQIPGNRAPVPSHLPVARLLAFSSS